MRLRPVVVEHSVVGCVDDARAARLARFPATFEVTSEAVRIRDSLRTVAARSAALDDVARQLADEGALTDWRDERYAVATHLEAAPLLLLERAAARYFGIATQAAHVNATTRREGEVRMWIARRSATKSIDPGLLDNLVGGGLAAGSTIAATVVKEAAEEAGIPASVASRAQKTGAVRLWRAQPDGIQDETIHVHDLKLPAAFVPANADGEVSGFRLERIEAVAELCGNDTGEDVVTADAALVIADWLLRHAYVQRDADVHARLDRLKGFTPRE